MKMWASIPAAAAYAAAALAAFPAEGMAILRMPSWRAIVIAVVMPRALKEAVGFIPSSLTHRSLAPIAAPRRDARIRGVMPSPRETIDSGRAGGSTGRYRQRSERADRRLSRVHAALIAGKS